MENYQSRGVLMEKIDLKLGKITYNEFKIDFGKPFSEQIEALTEDLVQIEYENGYLIDLGWYPEYDSYGELIVQVIKHYDWESPIYKEQSRDEKQLKKILLEAIEVVKRKNIFN